MAAMLRCSSYGSDPQPTIGREATVDRGHDYGGWRSCDLVEIGGERWQAIIDTGFNGELELSHRLRTHVNGQFVGRVTSLLAANQRIEEDVYLVDFPFDGNVVRVQATFVDGNEILIGTLMLHDYRLQIDFPAQTVAIEKA